MNTNSQAALNKWKSMSHKERNQILESIGGCGNCGHWNRMKDPIMKSEYGCDLKGKDTGSRQLYDGGCLAHTRLMNAL